MNYGSHYQHTEYQRVLEIDKRSGSIVDTIEVRKSVFAVDVNSWVQRIQEESTASFDLAAYIREHSINAPFTEGWEPRVKLDKDGLFLESNGERFEVMAASEIRSHIPPGGELEELRLLGVEFTSAIPDTGLGRMYYFRISSYPAGSDSDGSEVIVMVPAQRLTVTRKDRPDRRGNERK